MDHGARPHAKYSSSGAHRDLACPGNKRLCADMPERPDSEASEEGTQAHQALQNALLGLPNWQAGVPSEIVEAVGVVLDYVEGIHIHRAGNKLVMMVEQYNKFPQHVVPEDDAAGIADLVIYDPTEFTAWSIEFKYGMIPVDERRNPQLLFNACAALWLRPIEKLICTVVQPRVTFHPRGIVREWEATVLDMIDFTAEYSRAIEYCERPDAPLIPGPHCRYCAAEVACSVREQNALAVAFGRPATAPQLDGFVPPDPKTLTLDRLAYIRQHASALREWLKAVDDYAFTLARSGTSIPGEKLVEAQAARKWQGTVAQTADALAELTGMPASTFIRAVLPPITEAEAMVVKAARDRETTPGAKNKAAQKARERMAFLTLRTTSGNLSLVPESDPRPAVNPTKAAFGNVVIPPLPGAT
jgi:Protein of unknown function (DUF2800)